MPPVPNVNGSARNYPRLGAVGGDRASAMARPAIAVATPGTKQRNQIVATGATSGTFGLRLQGRGNNLDVTAAGINFNDPLATVVSKLNTALNPVGVNVVGVSGGPLPAAVVVEIDSGESFTLSAVNNTLVGGSPVITLTQTATGGVHQVQSKGGRGFAGSTSSAMARPRGFGR
jgi:hypothetical protein